MNHYCLGRGLILHPPACALILSACAGPPALPIVPRSDDRASPRLADVSGSRTQVGKGTSTEIPAPDIEPPPTSRAVRLTHRQWESSVRDALGLSSSTTHGTELRPDPVQGGTLFAN